MKSTHFIVLALDRNSHIVGFQDSLVSPTTEPDREGTCNRTEFDTMPMDQSSWGMLGELEGFGSWDENSWDNGFGFFTPFDI